MIFGVEFDGVIAERRGREMVLRTGAKQGLLALRAAGHTLILHTTRASQPPTDDGEAAKVLAHRDPEERRRSLAEMEAFLRKHGLWAVFVMVWDQPGKPTVDRYLDARALAPRWPELVRTYG